MPIKNENIDGLTEEQEKTGRLFLRLPAESIEEIAGYIGRSGVIRSQFLAMAMMLGARSLDRALYPQGVYTPAMMEQLAVAMTQQFANLPPDQLEKVFAAEDASQK